MMNLNTRTINAGAKAQTIKTSRKFNQAIAKLQERHYEAHQRFLALEERFKKLSNSEVSYVSINGISMPVPYM